MNDDSMEDEDITKGVWKSIISITVFGFLGWICHLVFGWSTGWSIGIGLFIGWFLPGFLGGIKEGLDELKEESNGKD